jgi:hypothetical protein
MRIEEDGGVQYIVEKDSQEEMRIRDDRRG